VFFTKKQENIRFMRQLLSNINRYFAFKLKELEFRLQSWKRAKEISRAYETGRQPAVSAVPVRVRVDWGAFGPYAVKAAKIMAIGIVGGLLIFGAVKAVPLLSKPAVASGKAAVEEQFADTEEIVTAPVQEVPEGAIVPEAAVLPEGYGAESSETERLAGSAGASAPVLPSGKPIADIFKAGMPHGVAEQLVLVDKAAKMMYLFKGGAGPWEVERAYQIATGERDGRKMVEGDKKTPEGVYFIVGRKYSSELTNLYGPAAFILDYPNEEDRKAGRTGHGIWVHGSDRGNIPPLFTQGCVAVSNPDILDFAGVVRSWPGVPVVIVSGEEDGKKHLASIDFPKLKTRGEEVVRLHNERQAGFENIVLGWKAAWEAKDIDAYSTFYLTSTFASGTQRWEAYRAHKAGLFSRFNTIEVGVSNIALTEYTQNAATVMFNQLYIADGGRVRHDNAKRIIFRKDQGNWKIFREIPFSKEEFLL
jgi:murein L,D-transpeptidase YafK